MTLLSSYLGRPITPEQKDRNDPKVESLDSPMPAKSGKPHDQFEAAAFSHLWRNRQALGIRRVIKFTALLLDGAVELGDGRLLAVEIKFRMNWEKACQAEWQFRTFLSRADRRPFPVDGGIVLFEEFSGDWDRQPARRRLKNGWNFWYMGHAEVDGLRLDWPVLDALFGWLGEQQPRVLPKSPMGVAIGYALGNRAALTRYTDAGFLQIDNNASERALRAVALGRKNYLFAGSDAGGQAAAVLYSAVGTCRRLGLDPFAYLRDAFARLPSLPADRVDDLFPNRWAAGRAGAAHGNAAAPGSGPW
jgi:hypothetical protein